MKVTELLQQIPGGNTSMKAELSGGSPRGFEEGAEKVWKEPLSCLWNGGLCKAPFTP